MGLKTAVAAVARSTGQFLAGGRDGMAMPQWAWAAVRWRWTTGRGVIVEAGCGILAYLAAIPLVIARAIVSLELVHLRQQFFGIPDEAKNPIFEIVSVAGTR